MSNYRILFAATVLLATFSTVAEAKLYKWTDEKGIVHYGSTIPPEYAGQDRVQFDDKGRQVKAQQKADTSKIIVTEEQSVVDQRRRDQALLDSYSTADEIDMTRDRNLQQVNARIDGIQQRMKTAQGNLDGYQKEKDALVKAGRPVGKDLQEDIDEASAKVSQLQNDLAKSQADANTIHARYDAEKQRFIELKGVGKK